MRMECNYSRGVDWIHFRWEWAACRNGGLAPMGAYEARRGETVIHVDTGQRQTETRAAVGRHEGQRARMRFGNPHGDG